MAFARKRYSWNVLGWPIRGTEMQRVSEFVFYELAIKVHKLTEVVNQVKYSQVWAEWADARDALDEIYRQRPLNFTGPAAYKLYQLINGVVPQDFNAMIAKVPDPSSPEEAAEPNLPWSTVTQIREAAKEFETVLRNECNLMDTYFVSKKGTYSTVDLVEHAHHHVPEPTRSKLPQLTRQDFDQAGKCIAFDVPTAAAFHLLRGTEAVVREYYELLVPGAKKASSKMRNWGAYIRLLTNHGAPATVTSLLAHLKDVYRNPVFHPEESYSDERVQVLFGVCISAIVLMESEIDKERAKGATTIPFPATGTATSAP